MDHSSHRLSHRGHANHRHHKHQGHSTPKSPPSLSPHDTLSTLTTPFSDSSIHNHHVPRESATFLPHTTHSSLHRLHSNHNSHHGNGLDLHWHHHDDDLELTPAHKGHHHGDDRDHHRHHHSDDHGSMDMPGAHVVHLSTGMGQMKEQTEHGFQWTKDTYVLFEQWRTSSILEVALAMVVAALLAAVYELIRNYLSNWDSAHVVLQKMPTWRRVGLRVYRSFMHALTAAIGYVQMLFAMSYDLRIFVAIILGSGVGFFILGPFFRRLRDARRQRTLSRKVTDTRRGRERNGTRAREEEQQFIEDRGQDSPNAPSNADDEDDDHDDGRQRDGEHGGAAGGGHAKEEEEEPQRALSGSAQESGHSSVDSRSFPSYSPWSGRSPEDSRKSVTVLEQSALDGLSSMRDSIV